jgi:hypothetical protein
LRIKRRHYSYKLNTQLFDSNSEQCDARPHALYRRKLPSPPPYEFEGEELDGEFEDEDFFLEEFEEEVPESERIEIDGIEIEEVGYEAEPEEQEPTEQEVEGEEKDSAAESESSEDVTNYDGDNKDEEEVPPETYMLNVLGPQNDHHIWRDYYNQLAPGELNANPQRPGHQGVGIRPDTTSLC